MDDPFFSLGQEINRTVHKVLDARSLEDLGTTIRDTVQRTTQKVSEGAKRASEDVRRAAENARAGTAEPPPAADAPAGAGPDTRTPPYSYYRAPSQAPAPSYTPPAYHAYRPKAGTPGQAGSILWIVFGFLGAIPLAVLALIFWAIGLMGSLSFWAVPAAILTVLALAFMGMILYGFSLRRRIQRYAQYQAVIAGRSFCEVSELAAATGRDAGFVAKDLAKMVQARLFPEGYFNPEKTCFMLDYTTFQQYLQAQERQRREAEEKRRRKQQLDADPELAAIQQMMQEGSDYLTKIREIKAALSEADAVQKLDTLADVVGKIFVYVEKHPEKLPQIRKFLCYYLPTTLKLAEAYRDLDEHDAAEGVEESKREIREALDKINLAFGQLLSNLMQDDLLDLSADIAALETMFAQEGLTGRPLRPGK
ncbi:MAG TPA: 5-bromo-4-chloroindolyl phosphate hydrolysis family protein [Firmicutes bacterium]|nr:5-bromo-4-chloroindolyl phosphate hydrolysis family protein [Bacillota bacterium]